MKKIGNAALVVVLTAVSAQGAYAQSMNSGSVSRELEKTLPSIQQKKKPAAATPSERGGSPQKKRLIEDPIVELPPEDSLAAPIAKIVVSSAILKDEITTLIRDRAFNQNKITSQDLASVRQQIWDLGLKNKKLLHTKFKVVANPKEDKQSWVIVTVTEIAVRNVTVTAEGDVRKSVLDDIQREASRTFYQEKILDLNELDNKIKSRLRLGDVHLRTSIVPIDETHMDLKVVVKAVAEREPSALIQYDNEGGWAFGRDRLVGAASVRDFFPGDELGFIGMRTADIGNGDYEDGMYFLRAEYNVPVGELGVRFNIWASGLHYHEVAATRLKTAMNGEVLESGQGVIKPLFTDKVTMVDLRADYVMRYMVDRISETQRTNEKAEYSGRLKAMAFRALENNHLLKVSLSSTIGSMDLTGHNDAYIQDQASAKTNGLFSKLEGEGSWSGKYGDNQKIDFRVSARGQFALNNLDSVEQFSLGGATGLRAFGSGEASGDTGFMINGDVGYTLDSGVRPFAFYDFGGIWKSVDPWVGETGPYSYVLHDVGAGVSMSLGPVDLSASFAHQVGPNPGLSASGYDIDGTKQRYRIWSTISYKY